VGIDYAVLGVELARRIAEERGVQEKVKFAVVDVIKDDMVRAKWVPKGGFDVVLDKGTFDAISLSDERLEDGRRIYEAYAEKIAVVVKSGGLLVVTSCNWTEEELKRKLLTTEGRFSNTQNFLIQKKLAYSKYRIRFYSFAISWCNQICILLFRGTNWAEHLVHMLPEKYKSVIIGRSVTVVYVEMLWLAI